MDVLPQANDESCSILPCGLGEPMLALCQLLVCRNAWWKMLGYKPDWTDKYTEKYCIYYSCGTVDTIISNCMSYILAFPTAEVRDQFLDTFRGLIEEAKELL